MNHHFDVETANEVGVYAAIILCNLNFWQIKNSSNNHNLFDGKYWVYNSVNAWEIIFPYMTKYQIRKALDDLEKAKFIVSGCYNKVKFDRTKWFSVIRKDCLSNTENAAIENQQPIPVINTDINTDSNLSKNKQSFSEETKFASKQFCIKLKAHTGINWKPTTIATLKLVNARLAEGYSIVDLLKVINNMVEKWTGTEWAQYLQPSTLLKQSKFESYLNTLSETERIVKGLDEADAKAKGSTTQNDLFDGMDINR